MSDNGTNGQSGRVILGRESDLSTLRRVFRVEIPGLHVIAYLRELSVDDFDKLPNDVAEQLALILVDERGERLYTTPEEVASLKKMSFGVMKFLLSEATRLNGATNEAIEAALKNFEASRDAGSAID